ncbi:outer membrane-specific lipoprotein transporter subunit LolE [Zobellella denitrificans]|uniref:Outer membrane-specific lipoprotein transporter subunit LolE n=1 Tax=Zobellella denitrificans TaxID=347534 RepID=A0A291HR39_9GAMM|nr:lipoprotein-releasing ABC transporter permease subunit LolE [Zobellella denitrificans]ATG74521.1 outer membrane-specific lipoprotein transporter subunit LolE [Zobellella denitrificans]
MFRPLSVYLGWRFSRAKRRNRFISFISVASILGIAIGVGALILGLSAMNGFQRELENRILSVLPHGQLYAAEDPLPHWGELVAQLEAAPGILAAAPFVPLEGLLSKGAKLKAVQLQGVLPALEGRISRLEPYLGGASLARLEPGERGIILGKAIAEQLELAVGDSVSLLLPAPGAQGFGSPRRHSFTLVGILSLGGQLDTVLGYTHLADAQALRELDDEVMGFHLRVDQVLAADQLTLNAAMPLPAPFYVSSWMNSQGNIYRDIQLVRTLMIVVLLLVMAVASFNIVSTLVMAVNEKKGDIAILKTMGAGPWQIRGAFVVQGMLNGVAGVVVGGLLGALLATRLSDMVAGYERLTGHRLLNPEVYFIDFIPTEFHWADLWLVTGSALGLIFVATLYPAWRAGRLLPRQLLGEA